MSTYPTDVIMVYKKKNFMHSAQLRTEKGQNLQNENLPTLLVL